MKNTFIAILRGINVSGHFMIRMHDLKTKLEVLGFQNITTYIQSGNIIFNYEITDQNELSGLIGNNILQNFGFNVPVIVRNVTEIKAVIENNPFVNDRKENIDRLHVTFFSRSPDPEMSRKISVLNFNPDEFIVNQDHAYVFCPNGYGNTKINNQFFENKLNVTATTRNWKTVNQLVVIA